MVDYRGGPRYSGRWLIGVPRCSVWLSTGGCQLIRVGELQRRARCAVW